MYGNNRRGVYGKVPSVAAARCDTRVLIVEDERITAADLRASLTRLGYRVVASVASGEDAITQADECRPDIVIMDVRLRGSMDGVQAGRRINERWGIPVIYLSAFLDTDIRERARGSASAYLAKPFDPKQLQLALEGVCAREQASCTEPPKILPG